MADIKTVRLRDVNSGVVVQVNEETAPLLSGFEPADAKKASVKRSSTDNK